MKRIIKCIPITCLLLVFLVFSSLPTYASVYSGYYTFSASSALSGASQSEVTATPGMVINLAATSSITYNGFIPVPVPSFNVNTVYTLRQGGYTIDTQTDRIPVAGQTIYSGQTYTKTAYSKYVVPSTISPGTYTLDCVANVNVPIVGGQTYSSVFTINVVSGASNPSYTPSYTPSNSGNMGLTGQNQPPGNQNAPATGSTGISNPGYYTTNGGSTGVTGQNQPSGNQNAYANQNNPNGYSNQNTQTPDQSQNTGLIIDVLIIVISVIVIAGVVWYWRRGVARKIKGNAIVPEIVNLPKVISKPEVKSPVNQNNGLLKNRFLLICGAIVLILIITIGAGIYSGYHISSVNNQNTNANNAGLPVTPSIEPTTSPTIQPVIGAITGVVRDYSGAPMDGARVTLLENGQPAQISDNPQYSGFDSNLGHGAYRFNNVPSGVYVISAQKDGSTGRANMGLGGETDVFLQPNN